MGWDFAPPQHTLPPIEADIEEMKIALPGRSRSIPPVMRIGSSGRDTGFTAPQSGACSECPARDGEVAHAAVDAHAVVAGDQHRW
jgi:hypothetical protein